MTSDDLYNGSYLPDLLVAALRRFPDRPAVYLGDEVLTGREVSAQMSSYAQAFAARGLHKGSPTAMLSPNRPEVLFTLGANMLTGCRSSALHPMGSLDDHAYVIDDAEIETLVFDPTFAERAHQLQQRCPKLRQLLSFGPCEVGDDLLALAATMTPRELVAPAMHGDEVAGLAYTGGTTGKPKGVMGTYRSGATMTMIQMIEWEWPQDTRFLISTPLSHAGVAFFIPTLLTGGAIVVLPGFEPKTFLETIEKYRITATMLVPTMLYVLLDHPALDTTDLSSLETIYYGAAACSPIRLQEAIRRLGPIFFQFYGQAECPMAITSLKKHEHDVDDLARLASCGRPTPWVTVRLLDDDLNEVPRGEPGEICVQGPLVMAGYWKKPEESAAALLGSWLHTGDIAREDDDGFFTIVDRKKDMIVSGGFNVFPREIEDVLSLHPAISQCAVIGIPDERWGEAVKAVVVARPGATVDADELIAMVRDRKGAHYAPKTIDVVDAIPVSPLGKPDKKALRSQYWGGADRQVH